MRTLNVEYHRAGGADATHSAQLGATVTVSDGPASPGEVAAAASPAGVQEILRRVATLEKAAAELRAALGAGA